MSLASIHTAIANIDGNVTTLGRDRITITRADGGTFGPFGGHKVVVIDQSSSYLVVTNEGDWHTHMAEDVISYVQNGCYQSIV